MLKLLAIGSFGLALASGTALMASAKTITHHRPPDSRYVVPDEMDNYATYGLIEGRSMYRMEDPGTFYDGTDERGYMSGDPENPRTGN
jgi:hypothetical protein